MPGPLSGFRVIDISEVISGPLCAMILADQGADVIKVEPPGHGEESRQLANYRDGMAALYANCNHGKRSIGIDLKHPDGVALFYELAKDADVIVQNWRPGAAERLKVAEADLRKINPNVVYASITGYGDDGPYADRRGYDPIFQSLTGYVAAQMNPEIPIPDLVRNSLVDKATSFALAQGITAALLARERGAGGQHVRIAMLDAGLAFFWPDGMLRHSLVGDNVENYVVPGERYQLMATKDGQLVLWMGTAEQMRSGLRAVGRDDVADDPRQRGKSMLEEANALARAEAMQAGLAQLTSAEAYRRLIEHEVPAAPVLTHDEVLEDPQIVHNGSIVEATHPVYGKYRRSRPAVRFSVTPTEPTAAPSLYGENSKQILDELGLSAQAQQALRSSGAVTR
ncbi:MAG: crotonobetainyl-CoA:carnitine CoA-transferase CaiB-like acyl-CoA transferase [Myxococcota bacterium]|jgi:crotonobetainyl-CoA:carnitine CoA-transferase CaiB-like acyl-CoA transferase